jgi:hypothetical protein
VNGLNAATVRVEFFKAPDCEDEDEHAAAETARTAAAATSARARVRRDLREAICGYSHSVPIYVNVLSSNETGRCIYERTLADSPPGPARTPDR